MGHAVELYFDSQTEQSIQGIRSALAEEGIKSPPGHLGDRPHVSLAVFSKIDCDILMPVVQEYALQLDPFDVHLAAIGTFPSDEHVVFLVPTPTQQLLKIHQAFHHQLEKANLDPWAYYSPNHWVPHCTVELNIPSEQLTKAVEICFNVFKSLQGSFQEIGVVAFHPVASLAAYSLS